MKKTKRSNRIRITGINPTRFDRSQIKFYLILLPIMVFMSFPLIFIVCNAFKPLDELLNYPPNLITLRPTLQNFQSLIATSDNKAIPVSRYLFNSVISTMAVMLLSVLITAMAAYCMSKKKYKLKNILFGIYALPDSFKPILMNEFVKAVFGNAILSGYFRNKIIII